jgi:glutamine synthetase
MVSSPDGAPGVAAIGDSAAQREDAAQAVERLAASGVEVVLLAFFDNAGVIRSRAVPLARLAEAATSGVGLSTAWHVVTATDRVTSSAYIGNPAGDLRLVADAGAAAELPGVPGFAVAAADQRHKDGSVHPCCARQLLRRAEERLERLGLEARVGYELEWWCGRESQPGAVTGSGSSSGGGRVVPAHRGPAVGALPVLELAPMVRELVADCAGPQPGLETINAEYSDGQLECSLTPKLPVAACDANLLARLAIHAAARRHGLRASFSPAFAGPMGNGGHLHLSLWREGTNCFAGGDLAAGLQPDAASFLAGVLEHLVAMTAIGAPNPASYLRMQPSRWAGAWRCWGVENREAALRLIDATPGRPSSANVEVKCFDEAANPYLLLAALLHAGADGVERRLELPPPYQGDPAAASPEEVAGAGIVRLPESLGAAITAMERSDFLAGVLGPELFDSYLAVRREELAAFAAASEEEIVAGYLWRY